jgi:hypothetical protein
MEMTIPSYDSYSICNRARMNNEKKGKQTGRHGTVGRKVLSEYLKSKKARIENLQECDIKDM